MRLLNIDKFVGFDSAVTARTVAATSCVGCTNMSAHKRQTASAHSVAATPSSVSSPHLAVDQTVSHTRRISAIHSLSER